MEVKKDVLFGSMKIGIKGVQKNSVWRMITVAGKSFAMDERKRCFPDGGLYSSVCAFTVEKNAAGLWQVRQLLDILSNTIINKRFTLIKKTKYSIKQTKEIKSEKQKLLHQKTNQK